MQTPMSVTTLNNQIKSLLEAHFLSIMVEGEVSRVTYHGSGHLYFTLKDKNSAISCVMFKGNNQRLKFRVEEGMQVIISGGISLYTPRGSYQINCVSMEPSGSGALALAYEQLKKKLETKGYFDQNIKKPLPKFPKTIAIVTSKTGAALQDMKRVASKRWALVKIVLFDTVVQGESAAFSIATNIKKADTIGADIIIVGRGGGSLEDLWAFNEEVVADAIFQANTPIISAVGHEIDFMISDGVSDLRAPTPSAAMELALPDINEMRLFTDSLMENFIITMKRILLKKSQEVQSILSHYKQNSFKSKISFYEKEIKVLKERFHSTFSRSILDAQREYDELKKLIIKEQSHILFKKEHLINTILQTYKSQDPSKKDKIGIAHIVKNGKKINLESLSSGDKIELQSSKTILEATILNKKSL